MRVYLIAVGTRMPDWVNSGVREYTRRLPSSFSLEVREIGPGRRSKGSSARSAMEEEGRRIVQALPGNAAVVALDESGVAMDTPGLAHALDAFAREGRDVAMLTGGPDGLAPQVRERAEVSWSLSPLTLPHGLVRILIAEQVYRAWTILTGHPYHRGD